MERNLNKLKKKYGTPKLVKFLRDLNPHLSQAQKKLNKEYIRYTRFGATGTPPQSPTPPPAQGPTPASQDLRSRRRSSASSRDLAPIPFVLPAPNSDTLAPIVPPVAQREPVKRSGGIEVNVQAIKEEYNDCINELATITKGYLNPEPLDSFSPDPKKDLEKKFLRIFKKYQGALHLVHNTKNLEIERNLHFGAKQKIKGGRSIKQKGGRGGKRAKPRARRTDPPTEPILMPEALLQHISPQAQPVPDKVVDEIKKRYNQTDSQTAGAQNRGWMNTYRQNSVGPFLAPTRRHQELCHCALCGARMFVFSDSHKNSACFHSTELEHQNPGSRAVELYIDVWKETIRDSSVRAFLTSGAPITPNHKKFLLDYERIFFTTIGGSHANVENAFVYCCTLCNQIKSNMLPYYLENTGSGDRLVPDSECLKAFDRRLKNVFIDSINGKSQGPNGGAGRGLELEHFWETDCKLNYYYGCGLVWTCQIIATFIIPADGPFIDKMKYDSLTTTRPFYDGSLQSIYDIMEVYKTLANERTPEIMWDSYVRNPEGQKGDSAPLAYFGRPVDQEGKTRANVSPYTTLYEKYADIMLYMKQRLRRHQTFST